MVNRIKLVKSLLKDVAKKQGYDVNEPMIQEISTSGENYSSYTFQATLSAPNKPDLKLFIKLAGLSESSIRNVISRAFQIESFFYTTLLEVYRRLEDEHILAVKHKLRVAKLYRSDEKSLILEDLKSKGYETFDRIKSLTFAEVCASLKQLARFHALSLAFSKKSPEEFKSIKPNFVVEDKETFYRGFINNVKNKVIEAANIADKKRVAAFIEKVLSEKQFNSTVIKTDVIIHRDFRPSNLMYQIKEGLYDIILLDFQAINCGSPIYDIMYFLDVAVDKEYRLKHFQESLDFYYSQLCKALKRLDVNADDVYSRKDFEDEYNEILPLTVVVGMCTLFITTLDDDFVPKDREHLEFEQLSSAPINEHFTKRLRELIEFYTDERIIV